MHVVREEEVRARILVLSGVLAIISTLILATALLATDGARGATTWDVDIRNFEFNPPSLPIAVGDTVVWTNNDGTLHTVTSTDGSGELASGDIPDGGTYSHKFDNIGVFTYRCDRHPSMTGSVAVDTVIPEFSTMPFVALGLLGLVLAIAVIRRKA